MKLWLGLLLCFVCACAAQSTPGGADDAWVTEIARVHAAMDRSADPRQAHALLQPALKEPVPPGIAGADRRRVLQDLYFRSALLSLELAEFTRAAQECELGLALGDAQDEFTANLWIARGRAEAKLGRAGEAAKAYARAMSIHEQLMNLALDGAP